MIFDEPTNHIDADTRNTLESALLEYKGTILFVSHDRYFINKIATSVAKLEDGKIEKFVGNFDDYQNTIKNKSKMLEEKKEENIDFNKLKAKRKGNWI